MPGCELTVVAGDVCGCLELGSLGELARASGIQHGLDRSESIASHDVPGA